jgi:hypothetical protein
MSISVHPDHIIKARLPTISKRWETIIVLAEAYDGDNSTQPPSEWIFFPFPSSSAVVEDVVEVDDDDDAAADSKAETTASV